MNNISSVLRGIWITPMGLGDTRTGNVRYTKQLWDHIRKSHTLDLVYYQYQNTIEKDYPNLKLLFNNIYPIVQPSMHFKVRAGEGNLWSINDFVSTELLEWCSKNITSDKYDFVVCDYIYMTPTFDAINDSVIKILNSHDQIGDKHIKMKYDNELIKKTFSISKEEELSAIEKCDIVMCITDEEKSYFDSFLINSLLGNFTTAETILIQHLPNNVENIKNYIYENKSIINLGFMGSSNIVNVEGLNKFLNYFKDLNTKNVNLILAGKICEKVSNDIPNVILLGEVNDERDFYNKIDIIVNPMPKGTSGLKIKTIDAFAYSLPIIGTKDAFFGIDSSSKWHNFDDIKSLSNSLVMICDSETIINEIHRDTKYAAHKYWRKVESQLNFLFHKIKDFKSQPKDNSLIWIQNKRHNYDLKIARLNERYSMLNEELTKELKKYQDQSKSNYHKYIKLKSEITNNESTSLESTKKKINLAIDGDENDLINFVPIIRSRYLREYSYVKLYLSNISDHKDRFFSFNENIELLSDLPNNLKIHKISIPEIVNHSSWKKIEYIRNENDELVALKRFREKFGKDYILINQDTFDNQQTLKNILNKNFIHIESRLKTVLFDKKNLVKNGLGEIKFFDLRKIIENAKYLHFSYSCFSNFADICDLSSHYQLPALHLYQNSENKKNDLSIKTIESFIKNKQWFKSKWKIYLDRDGLETC